MTRQSNEVASSPPAFAVERAEDRERNYSTAEELERAVAKARRRLAPFLALMFAISILDRSNVGFAKEALRTDAHIGDAAYALGAGIFFLGYAMFELPSNLLLQRVGARRWLSRIMVTWGIASALMMFAHSNISFYALRFLVGVSEAGFSPGVILYCTHWFPARWRGKALGIYYMGLPAALVLGSAISGILMQVMNGCLGLHNWQWMFLIEGLSACVVGVLAFFLLTSRPRDAQWLTELEKQSLEGALAIEEEARSTDSPTGSLSAALNPGVLRLAAVYFAVQAGIYGVIFYLPSRVSQLTGSSVNLRVGLLAALPWFCALLLLRPLAGYADRLGRHQPLASILLGLASLGLAATTQTNRLSWSLATFCVAASGFVVVQPLFWTLPAAFLRSSAAPAGIAVIGSVGNLGGFVAPTLKTAVEQIAGNHYAGMLVLAGMALVGTFLLHKQPLQGSLATEGLVELV